MPKIEPEMDEQEIYINYIVGLHLHANKLKVPTEKFTTDDELTTIIGKLTEAEYNKDRKKIKIYKKEAGRRIIEIEAALKKNEK